MHRARGFTLLEMLVVIVLIGVAAGLVGYGMQHGLHNASERKVVVRMVEALRATRVQAIVTGQPARTHFDLAGHHFKAPGKGVQQWPADMNVQLHTAADLGAAFEFYPDGGASGGHLLLDDGQQHWRIDVSWLTGAVNLQAVR